jgi:Pyridoxamine 5'-phosphate oxidase
LSRLVGKALSNSLIDHLARNPKEEEGKAVLLMTSDLGGWPHVAILSSWEVFAHDKKNIRVATYATSNTTENMRRERKATLVVVDKGRMYYIKTRATIVKDHLESDASNALLNLKVQMVSVDSMPGVKMTGIGFTGTPTGEQHGQLYEELKALE